MAILSKNGHLKRYFPSYVKFLVSLFLSFCTNEKNVLQREIKDWAFEFYLLTGEPSQFMISADWIIEHDLFQILCVVLEFLNFFWNGEGWDCFWLAKVLPRLSKIIYLPKVSKNKQVEWILICSKSAKWLSILNCSMSEKWLSILNCPMSAKWAIWESIHHQSWRS